MKKEKARKGEGAVWKWGSEGEEMDAGGLGCSAREEGARIHESLGRVGRRAWEETEGGKKTKPFKRLLNFDKLFVRVCVFSSHHMTTPENVGKHTSSTQ